MRKTLFKTILLTLLALSFFYTLAPSTTSALNLDDYTQTIANQGGYQTDLGADPNAYLDTTLGKLIAFALGFVGLVFFGFILVAGWQILTSGGNEEKVKKGKGRIVHATIGLGIIVVAYIISYTIFTVIETARLGGKPPELQPGFECQNNADCIAQCTGPCVQQCPPEGQPGREECIAGCNTQCTDTNQGAQPYCAKKGTYSFCTVCLEDSDCRTDNCIKTPVMHSCGD